MAGYRTPGRTQATNKKNHNLIRKTLSDGAAVEILALPDTGLLHYGRFHLNLAAALEDDIIHVIDPEWNGGAREPLGESAGPNVPSETPISKPRATFTFKLGPTYYHMGFFNVGVASEGYLGGDGEKIELLLGDNPQPTLGMINRRSNPNGTPRVMGGTGLRDWFRANASKDHNIQVEVFSPTSIRLVPPTPAEKDYAE